MRWTLDAIASITGGRAVGSVTVTSITTDSRAVELGGLFVALRGEHHDGHDFAGDAVASGAAACMTERGRLPSGVAGVEVDDPLWALADLTGVFRADLGIPVVAITGSSGKTTTKDMTAAALGPGAHAARHSHNNEIGVPLTVLSTPSDATAVVAEVGSRGIGQIEALGRVLRPDVAVITNIGPAHLETFGDLATVARAKWELIGSLRTEGVAVIPADLEPVGAEPGRVVRFGEHPSADVSVEIVGLDDRGRASCVFRHDGGSAALTLPVPGRHQAHNAAAAIAVAVVLGHPLDASVGRVATAALSRWRMEVSDADLRGGRLTIVNDAYNANPASMSAALETVAAMPGRHVAVLGRMHELGVEEGRFHADVGALAARLGFATVVVVGDDPGIAAGAGRIAVAVPDGDAAVSLLGDLLEPGDVVLVKASRATGLETVAAELLQGVMT